MRHPHADLIKKWAEDTSRVVECRPTKNDDWHKARPDWDARMQYRFKPEPKPDLIFDMKVVWKEDRLTLDVYPEEYRGPMPPTNLKLTFDGETGKLIKAEMIE